MAFTNGTYKIISILVNSVYVPIGCLTSNSFSESSEMIDTTTRQNMNGWKTSIPTMQTYSISFSGLISTDNKEGTILTFKDLRKLKRDKTKFSWRIKTHDPSKFDYGFGYINSISENADIDAFIDFSAEIQGYGQPYENISIQDQLNYTLNVTI